jgi:hypothetical protein
MGLDHSFQGVLLLLQLLSIFPLPLAQGIQLCDLLAQLLFVLSKQVNLLDNLVKISDQSMMELHLTSEAPDVVTISCVHHHNFNSFSSVAWEVVVL